jgi:hypothetical protein
MDISLMHTGLAAGAALAALPVILHLFMKQTPKKVVFPALRLIRERHKRSRKKLRVKNWLLLLARMALLALMALALARPTLESEAALGDQDVPTALGLVFDTSLSMGYTERDKSRLDEAKERAREILKKIPGSSQVFVVDSAEPNVRSALSPSAALKQIDGLTLKAVNRPLNTAVGQAYAAIADSDKPRHEVYVLTDLANSAWDSDRAVEGLEKAAKVKTGLSTYVLRLTPHDYHDVAVTEAKPASAVVVEGEPVEIKARVRSVGPATERVAQLWLDGVMRDQKPVQLLANSEVDVLFTVPKAGDPSKPHQGEVRLTGARDPLAFDDVRYFTFAVQAPTKVLVVSDLPIDAEFIADAVDPPSAPPGTPRPYRVERVNPSQLAEKADSLAKNYRCVFLNNVSMLSESLWGKLGGFVLDGGGLVIGLGGRSDAENYHGPTAAQVLPATPDRSHEFKETGHFGEVTDNTHPLFQRYPKDLNEQLGVVPVYRYWRVTPREGSRVLVTYTDKAPALIERVLKGSKTGRVLLWTTPLSRRADSTSTDAWNEFPVDVYGWSFWYLMQQSVAYLAGTTEEGWSFEAGRDVVLPIDVTRRYKTFLVQDQERKTSESLALPPGGDSLVVVAPQHVGQWQVNASGEGGTSETLGFSVNAPESESRFVPLGTDDLDKLFGNKKRYTLVDSTENISNVIIKTRTARELFPWLMFAILLIVTLENLLANRFHRETAPQPA